MASVRITGRVFRATLVTMMTVALSACKGDSVSSPPNEPRRPASTITGAFGMMPFGLELKPANLNVCEPRSAGYGLQNGIFKGWTLSPRVSVTIVYTASDTVLTRYIAIAFDRDKRRATQQVDCVLNDGVAARQFMTTWGSRSAAGQTSWLSEAILASAFSGDQWCLYHFDGGYITCGSTTCWPEAASLRTKLPGGPPAADTYSPGSGGWNCNNGCDINYNGTWTYDCGASGSGDLGSGGGGVAPPPATLSCSANVQFNQTATCTLSIEGYSEADDQVAWMFEGSGDAAGATAVDTTTSLTWAGNVVASGNVSVRVTVNGAVYERSVALNVARRVGPNWDWSSQVGGRRGNTGVVGGTGEIDTCLAAMTPDTKGLTASYNCAEIGSSMYFTRTTASLSDGNGLTMLQVGTSGPNKGLWYIASTDIGMDLRTQIHRRFRDVEVTTHPTSFSETGELFCTQAPRSVYQLNTECYASSFVGVLALFWAHETEHLDLSLVPAKDTSGSGANVPFHWERLVANTNDALLANAKTVYGNNNLRVFLISSAIDPAQLRGGPYILFDWFAGSWHGYFIFPN